MISLEPGSIVGELDLFYSDYQVDRPISGSDLWEAWTNPIHSFCTPEFPIPAHLGVKWLGYENAF